MAPWLALVTLGLGACAAPPRPVGEAGPLRVAVAPLNLAVALPSRLVPAVDTVQEEILGQLVSSGARVALVRPADARLLWRRAALAQGAGREGGHPSLRVTAREFVRDLSTYTGADFDLLLLPSLAYRKARIEGRDVIWDGVKWPVRPDAAEKVRATGSDGLPGISLYVLALRRDGRLLGGAWGGLEIAYDALEPTRDASGAAPPEPGEAPFDDLAHVREGIAVALAPFVPCRQCRP